MENANKEEFKVDEQNKIYIIGGRGVGKTTFLYRILHGQFKTGIPQSEIGIMKSQYKIGNKRKERVSQPSSTSFLFFETRINFLIGLYITLVIAIHAPKKAITV